MTEHEITIDEQAAPDAAYRAFCTCGEAMDAWAHDDRYDEPGAAVFAAATWADNHAAATWADNHAAATWADDDMDETWADDHLDEHADETDPAPDVALFQALRVPGTDANGYAAYVESDSDEPGWTDRRLDPGYSAAAR